MNGHRAACRTQRAESPNPCPATRTRCRPTGTGCRPMTRGSRGKKLPRRGRKFPSRGNFRPRHPSGGAGDGIKEMLRKKFYVVRKKNHVVRKIFYVASISIGAASRKNRPRWSKTSRRRGHFFPPPTHFLPRHPCVDRIPIFFYKNGRSGWSFPLRPFPCAKRPSIRWLLSACLQRERLAQVACRVAYG